MKQLLFRSSLSFWFLGALGSAVVGQEVPELTSRIVDLAEVFSPAAEREVTGQLADYEKRTTNQVAVLTLTSLDGRTIEEVSIQIARAWGLGTAEKNNGVLLVVVPGDRKTRIEVGTGLEGELTDLQAGLVLSQVMRPHLRDDDFDAALREGVDAILMVLDGGELEAPAAVGALGLTARQRFWITAFMLLFLTLITFGALALGGGGQFILFLIFGNPLALFAGALMGIPLYFWASYAGGYLLLAGLLRVVRGPRATKWNHGGRSGRSARSSSHTSSSGSSFSGGDFAGGGASDDY